MDELASSCSVCGGDIVLLGYMGTLMVCRCRNCGTDFLRQKPPADIEDEDIYGNDPNNKEQ